jgi:hypothetical protein
VAEGKALPPAVAVLFAEDVDDVAVAVAVAGPVGLDVGWAGPAVPPLVLWPVVRLDIVVVMVVIIVAVTSPSVNIWDFLRIERNLDSTRLRPLR